MDRRITVPARLELLHALTRSGGATTGYIYRLVAEPDHRRTGGGHLVCPAGGRGDVGVKHRLCALCGNSIGCSGIRRREGSSLDRGR